ncbi:MAG: sugar phosphate isomerase/epimerase [Anaerolineae bacterium]|nr:sugar phosphate isomerase/epimerase [Anaerolineae bacterium]
MRLGISSYTYSWSVGVGDVVPEKRLTAFDLLGRARELGVQVLQLADGLALHELSERELAALAQAARAHAISLEVGARAADKATLLAHVVVAVQLGSPLLRVIFRPGAARSGERQLDWDESVALMREVLPDLARNQVCLGIETHESMKAQDLRRLIEAVDSPYVGVVYDTANSLGCFEPAEVVLETLLPYVVNFHAKDVRVRRSGHSLGFVIEGMPCGRGQLDLLGLIERVRANPTQKAIPEVNVIVEHWMPGAATMDETLAQEKRWGEESVRYLRKVISK